jgi:DNA-directed RNA polymerase specialized sigma24 family protein
MTWMQSIRAGKDNVNEYATAEDMRRVFTENLDDLYRLSLLLTGSPEMAEQCFVSGLEDSFQANGPFKEWAHSWAKRVIVKNAIRELNPHFDTAGSSIVASPRKLSLLESLLALGDFDRFVFVMSVLERYSEKECSLLLGRSVLEIRTARIRALEQLASLLASTSRESDQVSSRPLTQEPKEKDESQITHDNREAWQVA